MLSRNLHLTLLPMSVCLNIFHIAHIIRLKPTLMAQESITEIDIKLFRYSCKCDNISISISAHFESPSTIIAINLKLIIIIIVIIIIAIITKITFKLLRFHLSAKLLFLKETINKHIAFFLNTENSFNFIR